MVNLLGLSLWSKAFDLVNHDVLRRKLAKYLISPQALQWFTSYLDNRTQQCLTLGALSSPLTIERGVPQGSILRPVLFSVYINNLSLSLGEANTDMYADDTTLWSSSKSCNEIQQTLQSALNIIEQWLAANRMVPNCVKTKKLLIGTVQNLRHSGTDELDLYLNETKLGEIKDQKLLGVKLDKYLKWNNHVEYLVRKLNSRIFLLKRAKKHLTIHSRKLLYNAIIKPVQE